MPAAGQQLQFPIQPSAHSDNPLLPLQAVAACLQEDSSAIVTLKSSGIDRPAKVPGWGA